MIAQKNDNRLILLVIFCNSIFDGGGGPYELDNLIGVISSELTGLWKHQAASANG